MGAGSLSAVAGQHHAILDTVGFAFYKVEESVNATELSVAMPQQVFLAVGELIIGLVDGETVPRCHMDELPFPLTHYLAAPAVHRIVVNRERLVGDDQILVDTHHFAETLAFGACPDGVVEVEHQFVRLLKSDAIVLKTSGETLLCGRAVGVPCNQYALSMSLVECCAERVENAHLIIFLVGYYHPVDEQAVIGRVGLDGIGAVHDIGDADKLSVVHQA